MNRIHLFAIILFSNQSSTFIFYKKNNNNNNIKYLGNFNENVQIYRESSFDEILLRILDKIIIVLILFFGYFNDSQDNFSKSPKLQYYEITHSGSIV